MGSLVDHRLARRCDWVLLLLVASIVAVSLPTIYSASLAAGAALTADGAAGAWQYVQRQAVWLVVGLLLVLMVNTLDHHHFAELSRWLYWLSIIALGVVLVIGTEVNGSKSWLSLGSARLQPSEFAKIAVIIALARLFGSEENDASEWPVLLRSLGVVGLPMGIILLQPDLGTTITFGLLWLAMLWWAGARWWQLLLIVGVALAGFVLMWHLGVLADYQKNRITVLFNPNIDPRGQGYNLRQSLIAVGSGGMWGQGWLQGTQTHLRFLPERHTDFIFAVLAEEWGLVGASTLLLLYAALFWRCWGIVAVADSGFGRALAVGCTSVLLSHVLLNVGMVVGLLPITGLPLPFFSYGGSNLVACLVLVGILLNIGMRRRAVNYTVSR